MMELARRLVQIEKRSEVGLGAPIGEAQRAFRDAKIPLHKPKDATEVVLVHVVDHGVGIGGDD